MNKSVSKSTKKEEVKPVEVAKPVEAAKPAKKAAEAKPAKVEAPKAEAKAPVVEAPKAEAKTPKAKASKAVAEVVAPVAEPVAEAAGSSSSGEESAEQKHRRDVSRATVDAEFDALVESLNARLSAATVEDKKTGVSKLVRNVVKRLKVLKGDVARISKQRVRGTRQNNTSSGFMKPVKISNDMAAFTGWDAEQMRSRVEVTKYICDYIKSHSLQNPADRRQIVPDTKLSKLLDFKAVKDGKDKDGKALTYYYLQQKIQPHFIQA